MISWSKAVQTPFYVNCKSSSMIPKGEYSYLCLIPLKHRMGKGKLSVLFLLKDL